MELHHLWMVLLLRLRLFTVSQILACHPDQWECDDGNCISALWRCDGEGDCLDGTDEFDCDTSHACPRGQFSCVDSMNCVDMSARCDGKKQCPTGFDEENCEHKLGCLDSEWTCNNNMCIALELRCNGENDCLDNSDEQDCGQCNEGIKCPEGKCLSLEKRCDGTFDCADGRDEPITCGHICSRSNGGCSHSCTNEPWGVMCSCPAGYELSFDGAMCIDVNECLRPRMPCIHACVNTLGSYYCQCQEGFTLTKGSICQATGNNTRLVAVQRNTLGLLDVKSRHFEAVQFSVKEPVALAYDLARAVYYWADSQGRIHKTDGRLTSIIINGQSGIRSLACDWMNGHLYWTNAAGIYMKGGEGKSYTTVLSKNVNPSDLVLLPVESLMFWVNAGPGERVTIEKSWMDGSDRSSLTVLSAQAAHSLTADVAARRLYWISDSMKSIESVKLDGHGRFSIRGMFNKGLPLSLAVFEQFFYWSDKKGVWQAPVTTPKQRKLIWKDPLPLMSVFHELQQPAAASLCGAASCEICLLTKSTTVGYTCVCPNSKVLLPTGMCDYPRVVYGTIRTVNLLEFKNGKATDVQLFMTDEGILTFDVDWYRDWLYWGNQTGYMKRTSLTQGKTELIQTSLPVCLMKVDEKSGNLYWVSCDQKTINLISADRKYTQKLYDSQRPIEQLYLDWLRGGLLWLEDRHIFTISVMGGKPIALLHLGGGVVGTPALDLRANSLLWNSNAAGLVTMSLFWDRTHIVGKRWNITGSVVYALEPFLLSLSDSTMTLYDRRDGRAILSIPVKVKVIGVIQALKELNAVPPQKADVSTSTQKPQSRPLCKSPSIPCPQSTFLCISPSQVCDGFKDCPDGFDENNCIKRCASKNDFLCKDRRSCVSQDLRCDGRAHCIDGSDEMKCPSLVAPTSKPNFLKCRHGFKLCADGSQCILYSHVCDGQGDCTDGSDEEGCENPAHVFVEKDLPIKEQPTPPTTPSCRSPSVLCPGSSVCILQTQFCDGRRDCPDGSDEKCVQRCPYMTDHLCKDRRSCVSQNLVCDGRAHCFDASDEKNCPNFTVTPLPNKLKCLFGTRLCADGSECVLYSHECDGHRDCSDGSDEDGCETSTRSPDEMQSTRPFTQTPTTPSCRSPSVLCPGSSVCVLQTQICDGRRDCPDGFDEKCLRRCPYMSDFLCKDRRSCVSQNLVCDGRAHCFDASDEKNCPSFTVTPLPNKLKCLYGTRLCADGSECVLYSHECDGHRDCSDGSDEDGCETSTRSPDEMQSTRPFTQTPTTPSCRSPSVLCPGSSVCVLQTQICDGRRDCPDGFDEKCLRRCPYMSDFLCKDRRSCVSQNLVCDGRAHCSDSSDEKNCPSFTVTPLPNKLKCLYGTRLCADGSECVLYSHECDGHRDCSDGSDEDGCDNPETPRPEQMKSLPYTWTPNPDTCRAPSVRCPGSSVCIRQIQFCDGRKDCPDGTDEKCVQRCQYKDDFLCKDRLSCVSQDLLCDGQTNCVDGSDEVNCQSVVVPTSSLNTPKCQQGSKLCADGLECVNYGHVCDGHTDCKDGSDEFNCQRLSQATPGGLECPHGSKLCNDGLQCVLMRHLCDGEDDCQDGSDELLCQNTCKEGEFQCAHGKMCILSSQVCDGRLHCLDHSDEVNCEKQTKSCEFHCLDGKRCIPNMMLCDGEEDCVDGSDEVNCQGVVVPTSSLNAPKCQQGSKLCADGLECVNYSHVCDGHTDCSDGSDEDQCDDPAETSSLKSSGSILMSEVKFSCARPLVRCPESSVCIHPTQFCNGKLDCPGGFDENCEQRCPNKDDFLCKDSLRCIAKDLVCNSYADCGDGSDEFNCQRLSQATPGGLECPHGSKLCNDGLQCVLMRHLCDGEDDCQDGSDELLCQNTCKEGEFQCAHGKMCILSSQVCDGRLHCLDHSDEVNCEKQTKSCEFHCLDGKRCIPNMMLCDGEEDCVDGSDERGCSDEVTASPLPCTAPSVLCPGTTLCISQSKLCDENDDCPDGFDEQGCIFHCDHPADFLCHDRIKCIPQNKVCDGRSHCADGSDEKLCTTSSSTVSPTSPPLKCNLGLQLCKDGLECVLHSHVCDGEVDCKDGSDEEACVTKCKADEFRCAHGKRCIPKDQVCDGQRDCQDRSDEMNCKMFGEGCHHWCDNDTRCVPDTFLCDGEKDCADGSDEMKCGVVNCASDQYRCQSGQCVSQAMRCDGYADCKDHSDEKDCSRPPHCPTQLRCPNSHECLQKEWICDGEKDCVDGADEKNCKTALVKCKEYQWQCEKDNQCIPSSWRCDGKEDCENGKDEDHCSERKCASHLYKCGSGECLDLKYVCDGVANCADGSDEGSSCTTRTCSSSLAPKCEHTCMRTPSGLSCFCAPGFQLHRNGLSCSDIDECSVSSGVCKHICMNTQGSYVCRCHPGFYLEPDKMSCKAEDEPLLLASVQSEMIILGLHSATLRVLSSANRPVFSLDYRWAQNKIYWLSSNYQGIRWAEMSNMNKKGTLVKGVKSEIIAVDWVGKNMYWVDGLLGQILAVKLSNSTVKEKDYTVVLDLEQPSSLVLVSHKGLMLWSEIGSTPQIEQAGMDGSNRKVVVSRGLSWPVSLAFDVLDDRFYWADEKLRCIGSASVDGGNVKILQLAETPSPFAVSVFNDRVFWSDTKKRGIRSADKRTGKDQKVLVKRPGQPFAIKIMHTLSQPSVPNPCEKLPCSHGCLLAPAVKNRTGTSVPQELSAVCRCPKGLLLSKDGLKCTVPIESPFIMLLSLQTVYQIHLHSMYSEGVGLKQIPAGRVLALPSVNEATSMAVSIPGLALFVADANLARVDKLRLTDSKSGQPLIADGHVLKLSQGDSISGLAVDWVTSNLYWSSAKRPNLHVTSDKGYTESLLPGFMKGTTSIAVYPPSGQLCYTVVGLTGKSQAEVSCVWMDGRKRRVLWRKSGVPSSVVFSETGKVIYWADTGEGVIYTIGLDGSGLKQYKTGRGFLISFTFIDNYMIWMTFDKDITRLWVSKGLQPKRLWCETKISLNEIKAYSNISQSGSNSCAYNNGGCAHLCLPYPGGHTCRCGQGYYSVNVSSCAELPSCPTDTLRCPNSSKCINSSQFCDTVKDCLDGLDEQDCPFVEVGLSRTKSHKNSLVQSPFSPSDTKGQKLEASCDRQCNGHGSCVTEGTGSRCHCATGYKGEFCQVAESSYSGKAIGLGLFFTFAVLIAGTFIYFKRRDLALALSSTREKTLMSNMSLPSEHFSFDNEELDSPVDETSPGLSLASLESKQ